jgi:hypothetical protein
MTPEWRVAVRWVIVLMPSGRTWTSADARTAEALRQHLAAGLQQPGSSGPPVVMWEMRDAQGRVLTPAQQADYLDVLVAIARVLELYGL